MVGLALLSLVLTLAVGVAAGLMFLNRTRRGWVVRLHLVLALAGTALAAWLVAMQVGDQHGGPPAVVPLAMLAAAAAAGWSAPRYLGRSRRRVTLVLAGHAVLGVAGFLVFLAWVRAS